MTLCDAFVRANFTATRPVLGLRASSFSTWMAALLFLVCYLVCLFENPGLFVTLWRLSFSFSRVAGPCLAAPCIPFPTCGALCTLVVEHHSNRALRSAAWKWKRFVCWDQSAQRCRPTHKYCRLSGCYYAKARVVSHFLMCRDLFSRLCVPFFCVQLYTLICQHVLSI